MNARLLLLVLLFAATLALTARWWQEPAGEPVSQRLPTRYVDALMVEPRTRQYAADGTTSYDLSGSEMRHYRDESVSEIDMVIARQHGASQPPWIVSAPAAVLRDDGSRVEMPGPVTLEREATPLAAAWHIATRDLVILPPEQLAATTQPATIRNGANLTEAVGMEVHFADAGKLRLLNQVRGTYVTP